MKFSIVTPAFRSGAYIEATIKSIAEQSYRDFEHIVMDGGSQDGTVDILKRHPHIQWVSEKDKGQSDAINKGFRKTTGDILAWQNADDLYLPGAFETVARVFRENPGVDVVYGDYQLIRADGSWLCDVHPIDWNLWKFAHGRFVPLQPTTFWRRRVYEALGDLDSDLHYCMDVDFFARAAAKFTFMRIPELLGQFRTHDESKTHNRDNARKVKNEHRAVLARNFRYGALDHALFEFFHRRSRLAYLVKRKLLKRL
jgi:glycosyltransferase involved in cell wall biosynthesis